MSVYSNQNVLSQTVTASFNVSSVDLDSLTIDLSINKPYEVTDGMYVKMYLKFSSFEKTWNDTSHKIFDLKKLPEPPKTTSESVIANIGAFTQATTIGTMVTSTLLTGALS